MAKDLLLPGNIIGLHRKAVEKLSRSGNGDAALLYLCLAAGQTSGALPWGAERVEAARSVLIQLGLLRSDTPVGPPAAREAGRRAAPGVHQRGHRPGHEQRKVQASGPGHGASAGKDPLPFRPENFVYDL